VIKTVYHAMGIDNLEAFGKQNRPFHSARHRETADSLFGKFVAVSISVY